MVVLVQREARLALGAHTSEVLAAAAVQRAHLTGILGCHKVALDALVAVGTAVLSVHAPWDVACQTRWLAGECRA